MSERGEIDSYEAWRVARRQRQVKLYVLRSASFVKIGIAADICARVMELQVGNPQKIDIVWASRGFDRKLAERIERRAHVALADYRVRGEWFSCTQDVAILAIRGLS